MSAADRVKDTTTTTGTGSITLSGTPAATYQALSAHGGNGTTLDYFIGGAAEWEIGQGTITALNTFSRSVQASSNANALVNFSAGTKDVFTSTSAATMNALVARVLGRVLVLPGAQATPSVNLDNYDRVHFEGLSANITNMSTNLTGTSANGDCKVWQFNDVTAARSISWGPKFAGTTIALPTTTVLGVRLRVYTEYNSTLPSPVA